jgi:hypothetical protein
LISAVWARGFSHEGGFMRIYLATAVVTASLVCACGGGDPVLDRDPNGAGGASGAGNQAGNGGSGGAGGTGGAAGNIFMPGGQGGTPPLDPVDGGLDLDAGCGTSSVEAEQIVIENEIIIEEMITEIQPVAMYVMLDQSLSMQLAGLWDPAKLALKAFVDDPSSAGVDLALDYFPPLFGVVGECSGAGYSEPAVPIGRLPGHAPAIHGSLDALATASGFGTPIEGALRGVTQFCQTFQAANPMEKCIAVFVTDGVPELGCSEDYAVITQVAADAQAAGVMTFAVGLAGADFALLDMIAMAGGAADCSDAADRFACDVSGGATQLVDALNNIRDVVTTTTTRTEIMTVIENVPLECEWAIPEEGDRQFDKMLVNVELSSPGGGEVALGYVPDEDNCAARGWFYDDDEAPTRIIACEETCGLIQSTELAKVDILLGCETVPIE